MSEQNLKITEGYMPFLDYKVYYRIVGETTGKKKPLLLLHGGPGSTHNYFEVLDKISTLDGRMLISYDQLGCGLSFVEGKHDELFNKEVWVEELDNQILLNRRKILEGNGKISHEEAIKKAEKEFKIYREKEMKELQSDFDLLMKSLPNNNNTK